MRQVDVYCDDILGERQLPRRFQLGPREIEIIEILDHWPSQDHHYYKVRSEDFCVYILRHDALSQGWEVTMFERREHEMEEEDHIFRHNFRGQV